MSDNLYEQTIDTLKNNKIVVTLLLLFAIIIGCGQLKETYDTFFPPSPEAPTEIPIQETTNDGEEVTEGADIQTESPSSPKDADGSESIVTPPATPKKQPPPKPAPKIYKVAGHTMNEDGDGLGGVKVTMDISPKTVFSDESGYFEFLLDEIPSDGEFNLTFYKEGYDKRNQTYFNIPKTNILKTLTLENEL